MGDGFDDLLADSPDRGAKISDFQRDSLRELANIAAGMATTTLSSLTDREVKLGLPFMDLVPARDLPVFSQNNPDTLISYSRISGLIEGDLMTVLPGKSANELYDLLEGLPIGTTNDLDDKVRGRLATLCLELSRAYMRALTDFLEVNFECEGSNVTTNSGKELERELNVTDEMTALVLETDFAIPETSFEGDFILLASNESTDALLLKVSEKLG
jgi:chemotaxis protein CheY-P-specific phosphatase CheC